MDLGLKNKVALVTGGAAGIGAAVVRLMAEEGGRVAFADRDEAAAALLTRELELAGRESCFILADLTLFLVDIQTRVVALVFCPKC